MTILTMACRLKEHGACSGHIYLGSIYSDPPSNCQCDCPHRGRRMKAPVTQLTVPEALAASAAGLTEQGWYQLTDPERAAYRTNISHGQHQENR